MFAILTGYCRTESSLQRFPLPGSGNIIRDSQTNIRQSSGNPREEGKYGSIVSQDSRTPEHNLQNQLSGANKGSQRVK